MSIDQIVRAWKSDEDAWDSSIPENPVGEELSDEELEQVVGGLRCNMTCFETGTCTYSISYVCYL